MSPTNSISCLLQKECLQWHYQLNRLKNERRNVKNDSISRLLRILRTRDKISHSWPWNKDPLACYIGRKMVRKFLINPTLSRGARKINLITIYLLSIHQNTAPSTPTTTATTWIDIWMQTCSPIETGKTAFDSSLREEDDKVSSVSLCITRLWQSYRGLVFKSQFVQKFFFKSKTTILTPRQCIKQCQPLV